MANNRYINPIAAYYDSNGDPMNGGSLSFFVSGTSTPLATYSDESLTTLNSNPVDLDENGRPETAIFLQSARYKVVLKNSAGTTIWTADPVEAESLNNQGLILVTSYGAVGDGVTDDSGAFRDALQAAEDAGGGIVYFPKTTNNTTYLFDPAVFGAYTDKSFVIPSNTALTGGQGVVLKLKTFTNPNPKWIEFQAGGENMSIYGLTLDINNVKTNGIGGSNSTTTLLQDITIKDMILKNGSATRARPETVSAISSFGSGKMITLQSGIRNALIENIKIQDGVYGISIEGTAESALALPERTAVGIIIDNIMFENVDVPFLFIGGGLTLSPTQQESAAETSVTIGNFTCINCGKTDNTRAYSAENPGNAPVVGVRPSIDTYVPGSATYGSGRWRDITIDGGTYSTWTEWSSAATYSTGTQVKVTDEGQNGGIIVGINAKGLAFAGVGKINNTDASFAYGAIGAPIRGTFKWCDFSQGTIVMNTQTKHAVAKIDEVPGIFPIWYQLKNVRTFAVGMPKIVYQLGTVLSSGNAFDIALPTSTNADGLSAANMDWGTMVIPAASFVPARFFDSDITLNVFDTNNIFRAYDQTRGSYREMSPGTMYNTGYDNLAIVSTDLTVIRRTYPGTRFVVHEDNKDRTIPAPLLEFQQTGVRTGAVQIGVRDDCLNIDGGDLVTNGSAFFNGNKLGLGNNRMWIASDSNNHWIKYRKFFTGTVTGITQAATPVVTVTSSLNKPVSGEKVQFTSVLGMTEIANNIYTAGTSTSATTFQLSDVDTSGFTAFSSNADLTILGIPISGTDGMMYSHYSTYSTRISGTPERKGLWVFNEATTSLHFAVETASGLAWKKVLISTV